MPNTSNTTIDQIIKSDQIHAYAKRDVVIVNGKIKLKVLQGQCVQGHGHWNTPDGVYLGIDEILYAPSARFRKQRWDVELKFEDFNIFVEVSVKQ